MPQTRASPQALALAVLVVASTLGIVVTQASAASCAGVTSPCVCRRPDYVSVDPEGDDPCICNWPAHADDPCIRLEVPVPCPAMPTRLPDAGVTIDGCVWRDADGDGGPDAGESTITGVTVKMYTVLSSAWVSTTTTPGGGIL